MNTTTILRQLVSAYPNAQASLETIAVYDRLLADIPLGDLQTVIDQCIAECKFLPTVAEIRDRYHALTRTIGQASATEAWQDVLSQIRAVGYIGAPYFANAITAQVVKSMGWRELCTGENMVADRAHFLKMYDQLASRDDQVQKLLPQALDMAQRRAGLQPLAKLLPYTNRESEPTP